MPKRLTEADWDEEDSGEDRWEEGPVSEEGEEPTVPCPYCRREIHEDSSRCPYCEQYVSEEDALPSRKPWWLVGGALLCLLIVLLWVLYDLP
jgi:hypothetical protein